MRYVAFGGYSGDLKMVGKITGKKKAKAEVVKVDAKPLDHVLVPKVEPANEDDLKLLLTEFGVNIDKLPLIPATDPAIAFLNLTPGKVVKFHRKSLVTGDDTAYYRLVVGGE